MSEKVDLLVPSTYRPSVVEEKKEWRAQGIQLETSYVDGIPPPDDMVDLASAYNVHVWVYAAVWAIASNYAQLHYKAYRQVQDQYEEILDYPFLELLDRPNPYMSGYNLRELTAMSLELTGNAYWGLEFANGESEMPTEIWPIPSAYMRAVSSASEPIDHYIYRVAGRDIIYKFTEVIHLQYMSPTSMFYGQGSLEAVKQSVMTDIYAAAWNKYFFKNAARPDAVFETENVLGEDVRKRVLAGWQNMHRGAEKRGKTAIMEGGLKLREVGWKHGDMEFTELRKMMREEVLAAFGVPPSMVGILEYANYANVREQTQIFWKHTMIPKVRCIQDKITQRSRQLTLDTDVVIESDTSMVEALRVDEHQRAQTARLYWQMGVPLNTLIDKFDLPFDPVDGGDESYPQTGLSGAGFGGGGGLAAADGTDIVVSKRQPIVKAGSLDKPNARAVNDAYWKAFDQRLLPIEERFAMQLRLFFSGQQRRVQAAFKECAERLLQHYGVVKASSGNKPIVDVSVFFNGDREQKKMRDAVHDHVSGTYIDFAVESGKHVDPLFKFNLADPTVLAWLHEKELKLVRDVTEYTMEQLNGAAAEVIQQALEEGLSRGEAISEIAARIDDVYALARDTRSELIARTEILSASNAGSLEGMEQAGSEGKMWLAAQHTKNSRDWHEAMDGVVVRVQEDFVLGSGAHMNAPGDPSAAPEEICNCRCTIRSVRSIEEAA